MRQAKIDAVLAIADQPRHDGLVFSVEALRQLANEHPDRFRYDEETKKLHTEMTSQCGSDNNQNQADPKHVPFVELAFTTFRQVDR